MGSLTDGAYTVDILAKVHLRCCIEGKLKITKLFLPLIPRLVGSFFFIKLGHPRPIFRLFSSFRTNIIILTANICEIMSIQ